jgi:serine phosphatase RsbU (regulator of sigma subunit)
MRSAEATLFVTPFFQSLPPAEIGRVLARLRPVDLPAGHILFEEDQQGDSLFIILEGSLEIVKSLGTSDEHVVALRVPGEYIGEMSLFDLDRLRSATVRAVGPAHLLELGRADFNTLLERYPRLAYDMARVLNDRLKEAHNSAVRDLQIKNRQLEQAYQELKSAQAQIIEKEKFEHELELAHNIQMSILPREMPDFAGFNFGARIIPMAAVGGDFYDFIPLSHNRLGVAVGDVSGHGVPAALFMALTVSLLRAEACRECSPAEALRAVNRQLIRLNSEGMFVTVLYGVLDRASGSFTFARAGHGLPFVARGAGSVDEPPLEHGMALALFDDAPLPEQTLLLNPADTLLLYTDGVTEATDAAYELFGDARLKAALSAAQRLPAQKICDQILAQVAAFSGPDLPRDDVTILAVQASTLTI